MEITATNKFFCQLVCTHVQTPHVHRFGYYLLHDHVDEDYSKSCSIYILTVPVTTSVCVVVSICNRTHEPANCIQTFP
jgi:hypothetical protein